VPAQALRGKRWDPAFWQAGRAELGEAPDVPCAPLGEFIEHITYGPIVTGRRPEAVAKGVAIIDQGRIVALDTPERLKTIHGKGKQVSLEDVFIELTGRDFFSLE